MQTRYLNTLMLLMATLFAVSPVLAQPTARLQAIHNAADPAAAVVDVYIEELSTTEPFVDDFAFRTATPFVDAPAGIALTVTVAPGSSTSAADGIASFSATLEAGETYQVIASGVISPSGFESNPSGEDIGFTLLINDMAQEEGFSDGEADINVVHGSTDAPTVDVLAREGDDGPPGALLVNAASYSDITPYIGVDEDIYRLDVVESSNGAIAASFEADLTDLGGMALTVLASGFLTPENDQDGPAFGLLAVFPDGTAALLPPVGVARLQVIHNAADPAASIVDVYVEEVSTTEPFIDNFEFRTATPFVDVPSGTELTVTVAPGTSNSAADGLASFTYELEMGETYQLIANGVLDPDDFEDNPSGESIAFTLFVNGEAQEDSDTANEVQFNVVHGSTDAPAVDVIARNVATLVDDAVYGDITEYIGVPPGTYLLDVTAADNNEVIVGTFEADFSTLPDTALTVLASGFLTPGNDQNGPDFGLLAVTPDGTAFLLPTPEAARVQIIHNAADPAAAVVDIYSGGELLVDDLAFRSATPFIDVLAGFDLDLVVAPGNSTSPLDGIFGQSLVLEAGGTYQLIANGVLSPDDFEANPDGESTAFELFINGNAQEESEAEGDAEFNVVHGSTDAPTVDVRVAGTELVLVDDATYGDITGYIGVAPIPYLLDVTTADGSTTVATFAADLSAAEGVALTVLASGFLTPENDQDGPAFGLLAVFADGTSALLPVAPVSAENDATAPAAFELRGAYPNPFRDASTVAFTLPTEARVGLEVYDVLGRRVLDLTPSLRAAGADQIQIDARALPSGAYLYRLTAEMGTKTLSRTGRMTVVR